jgi:hypothetical protein
MLDAEQLDEYQHKLCNVAYAILPKAARIEVMLGCSAMLQILTLAPMIHFTALSSQTPPFGESSVRSSPNRLRMCKG